MEELVKSREDREDKGNSATARRTWRNKLANLEATLVRTYNYYRLNFSLKDLLTGVMCKAITVAKS